MIGLDVRITALLIALASAPGAAQNASGLETRHVLPIEVAMIAASAAIAQCKSDGFHIAVAVMDRDGMLRLLAASSSVRPISIEIAQRKARASVMFQSSSAALGERIRANPAFGASMQSVEPRMSGGAGALPIEARGEFLGALGISGAPQGDQDEACARAGLNAIATKLR